MTAGRLGMNMETPSSPAKRKSSAIIEASDEEDLPWYMDPEEYRKSKEKLPSIVPPSQSEATQAAALDLTDLPLSAKTELQAQKARDQKQQKSPTTQNQSQWPGIEDSAIQKASSPKRAVTQTPFDQKTQSFFPEPAKPVKLQTAAEQSESKIHSQVMPIVSLMNNSRPGTEYSHHPEQILQVSGQPYHRNSLQIPSQANTSRFPEPRLNIDSGNDMQSREFIGQQTRQQPFTRPNANVMTNDLNGSRQGTGNLGEEYLLHKLHQETQQRQNPQIQPQGYNGHEGHKQINLSLANQETALQRTQSYADVWTKLMQVHILRVFNLLYHAICHFQAHRCTRLCIMTCIFSCWNKCDRPWTSRRIAICMLLIANWPMT